MITIKEAIKILKEKGHKIRKLPNSNEYRVNGLYDNSESEIIFKAQNIIERGDKSLWS